MGRGGSLTRLWTETYGAGRRGDGLSGVLGRRTVVNLISTDTVEEKSLAPRNYFIDFSDVLA